MQNFSRKNSGLQGNTSEIQGKKAGNEQQI